jgi:lipid-binding SYLF domain-containing protein
MLSSFVGQQNSVIPAKLVSSAMAIAVLFGDQGVACVRLKTNEWSAPCAILGQAPNGKVASAQETVFLFMVSIA